MQDKKSLNNSFLYKDDEDNILLIIDISKEDFKKALKIVQNYYNNGIYTYYERYFDYLEIQMQKIQSTSKLIVYGEFEEAPIDYNLKGKTF